MDTLPPAPLSRKDLIMIELLKGQTLNPTSVTAFSLDPIKNASDIADGIIDNGAHPFAGRAYTQTGLSRGDALD